MAFFLAFPPQSSSVQQPEQRASSSGRAVPGAAWDQLCPPSGALEPT